MGDNTAGDSAMAVPPKVEPEPEPAQDRTPSSIESTPEAEEQPQPSQEQPQQPPKRKGGRKPVRLCASQCQHIPMLTINRSTLPPRSASSAIDRRRQRSGSAGPSTSSSLRQPSSKMKSNSPLFSRAIAQQRTSVSCCGTRTLCWSVSCSRRVSHRPPHHGQCCR